MRGFKVHYKRKTKRQERRRRENVLYSFFNRNEKENIEGNLTGFVDLPTNNGGLPKCGTKDKNITAVMACGFDPLDYYFPSKKKTKRNIG